MTPFMDQLAVVQPPKEFVVGRIVHVDDLEGRFSKWLNVPTAYRGVALYPDGKVRLFDPGRYCILQFGERASGKGVGLRVALLSAARFTRFFTVAGLRSGDGVLLKVVLTVAVEIDDPVRFLEQAPAVVGQLDAPSPDPYLACQQLRPLIHAFESVDLLNGAASVQLMPKLIQLLQPLLANNGLRLLELQPPAFVSVAEELAVFTLEQAQREDLKKIEHEAALAELERQAEKEDFECQLRGKPEQGPDAPVQANHPAELTPPAQAEEVSPEPAAEVVPADNQRSFSNYQRRAQPLMGMPPGYLNRQLVKVILSVVGMSVLTLVADPFLRWSGLIKIIEARALLSALWVSTLVYVVKIVRDAYSRLIDAEKKNDWIDLPANGADKLTANAYANMDGLLRTQSSQELAEIQTKVHRIWQNLLRRGQRDAAGALGRLEPKIEGLTQRVQDPNFGKLVFQADQVNGDRSLSEPIERDQELLLMLAEVADRANALEKKSLDQTVSLEEAIDLEKRIYEFEHRFGARRRSFGPESGLLKE